MSEQRVCLVHYHEIGLKGKNRAHFEKQLITNIKAVLGDAPVARIKRISGRICLFEEEGATYEQSCELVDLIAGIPGVARVSCGYRCEQDLEVMYETAIKALSDVPSFETFKVQARRNHTDFEIDSMQLNQLVGAVLCRSFQDKKVLMKNPDVEVRVEVIQGHCYIYAHSVQGVGGLPVGSAGKVVTLMSSGIDSPVATWRIARRGAVPVGVHFSGRPETLDTSEYLVDDIAHVLERTGCFARLYVVPIGEYQRRIAELSPASLRIVLYRRFMYMIAERIALMEGAKALVRLPRRRLRTSSARMLRSRFQCCVRSSVLTRWRSSLRRSASARSRYRLKTRLIAARSICRAILKRTLSSPWCSRLKKSCRLVSGSKRRLQGLRYTIIAALRIAGLSKPKKHK